MPKEGQYKKDFDSWNEFKKKLEVEGRRVFAYPREVWWCSFGVNLGVEIDGKNANFERPGVVIKVHNKESLVVLPTTSNPKEDQFHYKILVEAKDRCTGLPITKLVWVKLTQARTISNKRLLRKVDTIDQTEFEKLRTEYKKYI